MKQIISLLTFIILFSSLHNLNAQDYSGCFLFESKLRHYDVYLPQEFKPNLPLVLNLHGYSWSISHFADVTLMQEFADTAGYIIVYPEGSYNSDGISCWNTGLRNHPTAEVDTISNDVGFLSDLIDTLAAHYDIDLNRVYCCGFSQGGEMTYRIAIEKSDLFAGYASVSGKLNDISAYLGVPLKQSQILHFHGTNDDTETYDGSNDGNLWSVEQTINYWLDNNNCIYDADTISIPDLDPNDGKTVQKFSYKNCSDDNSVVFFKILNGDHRWPGGTVGEYVCKDINASSIILDFFNGKDSPPADIAYGTSIASTCKYIPTEGDTFNVMAEIKNPEKHTVAVHAIINGNETDFQDSIELYDDGIQNDSIAGDNFFGGEKIYSNLDEDFYEVRLRTIDIDKAFIYHFPNPIYFTTAGPIVIDGYTIKKLSSDRIALLDFILKNEGKLRTIENIAATLTTSDSNVTKLGKFSCGFGTLGPGETKKIASAYSFYIDSTITKFEFDLQISSLNRIYWVESFIVDVTDTTTDILHEPNAPIEFALEQNYPNPFNPSTKISYALPNSGIVQIKVFDLLGQEVITLVNEEVTAGYFEVNFNANSLPSGVYLYRLQSGSFVETKKMILLK